MKISTLIATIFVAISLVQVQARGASSGNPMDLICHQECAGVPTACFIPDPDNCRKFYECQKDLNKPVGWDAIQMICPLLEMFDTSLNVCNYADLVDCGTRPIN